MVHATRTLAPRAPAAAQRSKNGPRDAHYRGLPLSDKHRSHGLDMGHITQYVEKEGIKFAR
ncbi:MAG: hypothetical protein QOE52_979 [Mycobacterium sp.]|nr:hypothetical protein [Mycobacterium sp.]MDT5308731.1 hypothetical protein [Mycobacterium sp.]MDT5341795.1 hypothetical protein [Mycobacterium sp.]